MKAWGVLGGVLLWSVMASAVPWNDYAAWRKQGGTPAAEVIEVRLGYSALATPKLRITSLKRVLGYPMWRQPYSPSYYVKLVDDEGTEFYSRGVHPATTLDDPPPESAEEPSWSHERRHFGIVVNVPYTRQASEIWLTDARGNVLERYDVERVRKGWTEPLFLSAHGSAFVKTSLKASASKKVHITFIGDGYRDLSAFHADVQRNVDALLSYQPYHARASQIEFHSVDNKRSLGCGYSGRLLTCSDDDAIARVNEAGAPADHVIVIVNDSTYGGSGGPVAVTYNGAQGREVFVHEFGHSFADLPDEYDAQGEGDLDGRVHQYLCFAGDPPAEAWKNLVAPEDYTLGCKSPNWYRSAPGSLMLALSYHFFNRLAQDRLNAVLQGEAGPLADTEPPRLVVSAPSRAPTFGRLRVEASATDNTGVSRFELWVDGSLRKTAYESPAAFEWDRSRAHVEVKAFDVNDNAASRSLGK